MKSCKWLLRALVIGMALGGIEYSAMVYEGNQLYSELNTAPVIVTPVPKAQTTVLKAYGRPTGSVMSSDALQSSNTAQVIQRVAKPQ